MEEDTFEEEETEDENEEETEEDFEEATEESEPKEEKKVDVFKREMHGAVCAACGKKCEVPFKPTAGRPVYCRDCYQKQRPPSRGRRF